jgi:predicted enzyme related to lactoylglutathione lyase
MGQPVMQFQMLAKNPEAQAAFYTKVFSWDVDANNALGYRTIKTGSERGINGGIWPIQPGTEGHAMVQLFIEVDDVASYVEKVKDAGGNVVMPPQKLPDGDEMAIIIDPEGLPVGLFKSAK